VSYGGCRDSLEVADTPAKSGSTAAPERERARWAQVADIVAARAQAGKNYGVILIPEGLLEHVPEVTPYRPTLGHTLGRAARQGARILCRAR
jgi:6-phosphofructokinase